MTRILRYDIPEKKYFSLALPIGAKILSVGIDNNGNGKLWAFVDIDKDYNDRNFRVVKTGMTDMIKEVPKKLHYIGRFDFKNETFHVFEINK